MALSPEQFALKAKNLELTFGEAIEFALSRPTVTESAKKNIRALKSASAKMEVPLSTPYTDLRNEEIWTRFSKEAGGANRYGNLQKLESAIRPVMAQYGALNINVPLEGGLEVAAYPQITGATGISKGTQRTGLAGERPMRKLIPREEFDAIYNEQMPKVRAEVSDTVADALEYHRATFNRPDQLFGEGGIKKSEVQVVGDKITVAGLVRGKKRRPELTFSKDSKIGQIILRNLESSSTENLFDISSSDYDANFRKYISPTLLARFEEALPLIDKNDPTKGVVSTPSVIRSAMPLILNKQFGVPKELRSGLMGHIDTDILTRNYEGIQPDAEFGAIIEKLSYGDLEEYSGFVGGKGYSDIAKVPLSPEQQQEVAQSIVDEAQAKASLAKKQTLETERERVAYLSSEEGQQFLTAQEELQKREITTKLELQAFEKQERERLAEERKQAKAETKKTPALDDEGKRAFQDLAEFFKGFGKMAVGGLGITAVVTASEEAYTEEMERSGSTLRATGAGAARGAYEVLEPLPMSFVRPQTAGEGSDVVPTDEEGRPQYPFLDELEAREENERQPSLDEQIGGLFEDDADITITYPETTTLCTTTQVSKYVPRGLFTAPG